MKKDKPNCWTCEYGTIKSSAKKLLEFLDTATISCKKGLRCEPELCKSYKEKKGTCNYGNNR